MRFNDLPADLRWNMYRTSRDKLWTDFNESGQTLEMRNTLRSLVASIVEKMNHLRNTELGGADGDYDEYLHRTPFKKFDQITVDETNEMFKYENKTDHEIEKMKLLDQINTLTANTPGAASTGISQDLLDAQNKLNELQGKYNTLEANETDVRGQLTAKEATVTALASDVETEKGKLISLQAKLDDCTNDLKTRLSVKAAEELEKEKNSLTEKIEELNATISAAQQTTVPADAPEAAAVTRLNGDIAALKKELETIRIEKATLADNVATLTSRVTKLEQDNAALTQQLKAEQEKLVAALEEQSNELQNQHKNELTILLKFVENHLDPNFNKSQDYESEINRVCTRHAETKFDNLTLRDHVEKIKELSSKHCETEVNVRVDAAKEALSTKHEIQVAKTKTIYDAQIAGLKQAIAKHTEQDNEIARLQLKISEFQKNSSASSSNNPLEKMSSDSEDRAFAKEMWKFMLKDINIDGSMLPADKTAFKQRLVTMFAQEQFKNITRSIGREFVDIAKRIPLVRNFKQTGVGLWIGGELEWVKSAYKMGKTSYDNIKDYQEGVKLSAWAGKDVEKISKEFFDYMNGLFKYEAAVVDPAPGAAPVVVPSLGVDPGATPAAVPTVVPSTGVVPVVVPSPGVDPSLATGSEWDQMTQKEQDDYTAKQSEEMEQRFMAELFGSDADSSSDSTVAANSTSLSPSPAPVGGDGGNPPTINTNTTAPPPEIEDACYRNNNLTDALQTYYSGQKPTTAVRKQFVFNWLEVNDLHDPAINVGDIETVLSAKEWGDTLGQITKDRWNRILKRQGLSETDVKTVFFSQLKNLLGYLAINNTAPSIDPPVPRKLRSSDPPPEKRI